MPNKERAVELLKSKVNKLLDWVVVHSTQATTSTSKDKNKAKKTIHSTNSLGEIFDASDDENYLQKHPIEKTELDLYLADETRIDNMNVLTCWNLNKSLYPILARIAKRILAIPTTNTSVERLFSHSGNTITNRRIVLD